MSMTVETAPGQKLYRAVVDALRREIETGRFAETQLLPAERVLCELLDISRTTLRKAIADLIAEGVLYHRHGAGTFIHRATPRVEQPSSRLTNVFSSVLLTGRVSTSSRTRSITSGRKTGSSPSTSAVGYPAPSSTL